jgi:DNA primase
LHVSSRTLHKELKAAETALTTDPSDENYRHLVEVQAQMREAQAAEALIDGFGVSSGRAVSG